LYVLISYRLNQKSHINHYGILLLADRKMDILKEMVFGDIYRALESKSRVGAMILGVCAIDYMALIHAVALEKSVGQGYVKTNYICFCEEFLKQYDAEKIYFDLRNMLVHEYSIGTHYIIRVEHDPKVHLLKEFNSDKITIDIESFIADIERAFNKLNECISQNSNYEKALESSDKIHFIMIRHTLTQAEFDRALKEI
jgi:hypothetical protein